MASLADQFTDIQIDEMKEAFSMFDRNRDGNVILTQLPTVFRTLGIHISDSEIKVGQGRNFTETNSKGETAPGLSRRLCGRGQRDNRLSWISHFDVESKNKNKKDEHFSKSLHCPDSDKVKVV